MDEGERGSGPTTFMGFRRENGRVGIRNHVLVLGVNGLVMRAAQRIAANTAGAICVATPYGRGHVGEDHDVQIRHLVGLGTNPNVASVLVVGADRSTTEHLAERIGESGKPVSAVNADEAGEDTLAVVDLGTRRAGHLVRDASMRRREECGIAELVVGIECGHSDATSGIACNPAVGAAVDVLVDSGATVFIGETLEWLGAEHILAERTRDKSVAQNLLERVARREQLAASAGIGLTGRNPGDENIRGGLSTIEEKSLGAISKAGTRQIESIVSVGEAPASPGLHLMDGPSFSTESMTGFAAAGAQLILFTTGLGNGVANLIAPTMKISAHDETTHRLPEQIDFDAHAAWTGEQTIQQVGARLVQAALETAGGRCTWGEIYQEGMEAITRIGRSL